MGAKRLGAARQGSARLVLENDVQRVDDTRASMECQYAVRLAQAVTVCSHVTQDGL